MISLYHRERARRLEEPREDLQRLCRPRQMLQDKTDKYVVERFFREGQGKDVRLMEPHVSESCSTYSLLGLRERIGGDINREKVCLRALHCESDCLGSHATPDFEYHASRRIGGIGM